MYRISRGAPHGNPNPVLVGPDMFVQTSNQVQDHLLCRDCEELFNKHGERWVISHCYREKDKTFKLRERLRNEVPFISTEGSAGYDTAGIAGIEHSKIIYYSISVFWRAAVHAWRVGRETITPIDLGPYEVGMKRFLRSEDSLSNNVYLSVWLSDRGLPLIGSTVPTSYHVEGGGIMHPMNIPGIAFLLTVGKTVSDPVKQTCFIHVPGRPVFVSKHVDDQLMSNLLATVKSFKSRRR